VKLHKEEVQEYYILALLDLYDGATISELEESLEFYEDAEMYEACAGIIKAINESKYNTLENIKKIINEEDTKIN
tara:strand:+ start:136 stop:360 length:225 start_codon:yes stop_codon:yes gene_type:complete